MKTVSNRDWGAGVLRTGDSVQLATASIHGFNEIRSHDERGPRSTDVIA